jgi:hypothetical protein
MNKSKHTSKLLRDTEEETLFVLAILIVQKQIYIRNASEAVCVSIKVDGGREL